MKNKKLFLIIIIFILNLTTFLGCLFLYSEIKDQREAVKERINSVKLLEEKSQNVKLLSSQTEDIAINKEKLESAFLKEENIIGFIEKLESIGKEVNVSVKIFSAEIGKGSDSPRLRINLKGTFQNIFGYITLLENLPYQISFDSLNLVKKVSGDEKIGDWDSDIEISIISFLSKKND
ncbi:hypothetical protein KJ763_02040 [Patescibacteria group bacterium]|nr:hypothetical protein [Patescibacteria group bacterium]